MTDRVAGRIAARFGVFFDAAPDAMLVVDRTGAIVLANAQLERMFGYSGGELIGQTVEVLVPGRFSRMHERHRGHYAAAPHTRPIDAGLELFGRRKDGVEFPVEISLSPLETDDGPLVMSAVRDVTERRRLQEELKRQSRLKSEFLANTSHELRTPLNSIIGFAELMHDGRVGPIGAEHREYLGDILTSAKHLLRLINDLLDLSKVESGKMEFFPEPVDLPSLVAEARDLLREEASQKGITMTSDVPAVPGIVVDSGRLKQIVYNYLSNALKFTADGGHVTVRAASEGDAAFRVEVEDDGIGIRAEDLARLFVEFQQLDAGAAKRYQGTGLGLALTKRLAEAQGGRVGVSSVPDRGSRFFVVLPRAAPGS